MNKPDNIPESQTEYYALLCEIKELRAELEKLKRQWAEDDRDITALEDENNRLRAELAEAHKEAKDATQRLAECMEERQSSHDRAKEIILLLEKTVEVLREGLQEIVDGHCEDISCSCCYYDVEIAKEALANLPAKAEKVKAVLDAADYWYEKDEHEATDTQECLKEHPDCATCRLIGAVRERREK